MNAVDAASPSHLHTLSEQIIRAGWQLYFDVSPLFDEHWTGIPLVAAGLGRTLLELLPQNAHFFYHQDIVATDAVADAFARESGLYLERNFHQGYARVGPVPLPTGRIPSAGIYPSVKLVNSMFPVECSIYHDISTLILPQYHTIENVRHHLPGLVEDIRTNAFTFGVSQATVDDLIYYLGAPPQLTAVASNGVSWPWWFPVQLRNEPSAEQEGPYFLVLGTREPRKNLSRLFEALMLFPEILDRARIVLVGKTGWLTDAYAAPDAIQGWIADGRIVLKGYVSSFEKYRLLMSAQATIYPSLFEGFGLPVLESLSVGTPCIASWSSSIPEVGSDACVYFDPLSAEELGLAMKQVQDADPKGPAAYRSLYESRAATFTWPAMLEQILARLIPALAEVGNRSD